MHIYERTSSFNIRILFRILKISPATYEICKKAILVYAAYMIPRVINMIIIVGVCRGGGDTVFTAIIDVGAPWLIGIPWHIWGTGVGSSGILCYSHGFIQKSWSKV